MTPRPTIAVIGASLAGTKAAEAARNAGFEGRIVLVGEEPGLPYERPPLSKGVLRGEQEPSESTLHPAEFFTECDIELVHDRAVAIDTVGRHVDLAGGARIDFDAAVLATGSAPRRLTVPGAGLPGVHHLRTLDDSTRLRDAIRSGGRVVVVGAGWIGCEVAASARQMGADVVVVDPAPLPLQRVLGDDMGRLFRDLHTDHGVRFRLGTGVTELRGGSTVEAVVLEDGATIEADVVVVGIGVIPRVELAERAAGLRTGDGVVVDQHLATNVDGIYAAGDVADAWHPHLQRSLRVEHWDTAANQGTVAGRNAAGGRDVYDRLPYFFTDQYDLGMEYVGRGDPSDEVVVRGDRSSRELVVFWQREGVVTAAMNVNVWEVADELGSIVASGAPIDAALLADPDVSLAAILPPTAKEGSPSAR